jgi:hypothetical protein
LAGWWLVSYVHRSARFRFYIIRGSVPLVSLQLLWLQLNLGKLPFLCCYPNFFTTFLSGNIEPEVFFLV